MSVVAQPVVRRAGDAALYDAAGQCAEPCECVGVVDGVHRSFVFSVGATWGVALHHLVLHIAVLEFGEEEGELLFDLVYFGFEGVCLDGPLPLPAARERFVVFGGEVAATFEEAVDGGFEVFDLAGIELGTVGGVGGGVWCVVVHGVCFIRIFLILNDLKDFHPPAPPSRGDWLRVRLFGGGTGFGRGCNFLPVRRSAQDREGWTEDGEHHPHGWLLSSSVGVRAVEFVFAVEDDGSDEQHGKQDEHTRYFFSV